MDPLALIINAVSDTHRQTLGTLELLAEAIDTIDLDTPIPFDLAGDDDDDFGPLPLAPDTAPGPTLEAIDPATGEAITYRTVPASAAGAAPTYEQRFELLLDALYAHQQQKPASPPPATSPEV